MMLVDPFRFSGSGPVECDYLGHTAGPVVAPASTHTTTGCPAGSDYVDRYVFAYVYWAAFSGVPDLLSATIAGVPAKLHLSKAFTHGASDSGLALISAKVPTGATVDIGTTYSTSTAERPDIFTYRVVNLVSDAAIDTQINGGTLATQSLNADCDVVTDGVVFFAMNAGWAPLTCDVTGTSQDFEQAVRGIDNLASGGFHLPVTDETPRAFNSTLTGGVSASPDHANIVASFR